MINESMKWPTNKTKYDANYLRLYGVRCPDCHGEGELNLGVRMEYVHKCPTCGGLGYVEKKHASRKN